MSQTTLARDQVPVENWAIPVLVQSASFVRLWGELLHQFERGQLVIPDWQRGRVWTREQQVNWVGHVLSQAPLPAIFIREVNTADDVADQLFDGQQRLAALHAWTRKEIPARLWTGEEVWCLTGLHHRALERLTTPVCTLKVGTPEEEALRLYLALNTQCTPHTEAELDKVRRLLVSAVKRWQEDAPKPPAQGPTQSDV